MIALRLFRSSYAASGSCFPSLGHTALMGFTAVLGTVAPAALAAGRSASGNPPSSSSSGRTELVRCEVRFSYDSVAFPSAALDACLAKVDREELRYFEVFATASPEGPTEYNRRLSERRADALRRHLASRFKGVLTSRPLGGGENPVRGATGTIVAVNAALPPELAASAREGTAPASLLPTTLTQRDRSEALPAATSPAIGMDRGNTSATDAAPRVSALDTGMGTSGMGAPSVDPARDTIRARPTEADLRLAARAGIDRMRNGRTWYPAWGAEVAWLPRASLLDTALPKNLGFELGAQGNSLARNDVLDLYNGYGFAGARWSFLPEDAVSPVAGARALAGATWHARGQGTGDGGVEARAGLEGPGFSLLAGVGVTRHYHRFGLDAGLRF